MLARTLYIYADDRGVDDWKPEDSSSDKGKHDAVGLGKYFWAMDSISLLEQNLAFPDEKKGFFCLENNPIPEVFLQALL